MRTYQLCLDDSCAFVQLKARLKDRGLSPAGKKEALITRLLASDDMGLAPSRKETTKTLSKLTAAEEASKPAGQKAADPRQSSAAQVGMGFGAVAQPKRRVVKRAGALDADGSGSSQDDAVQQILDAAQEMARKEEAAVEAAELARQGAEDLERSKARQQLEDAKRGQKKTVAERAAPSKVCCMGG
jgi:hypothetical protein